MQRVYEYTKRKQDYAHIAKYNGKEPLVHEQLEHYYDTLRSPISQKPIVDSYVVKSYYEFAESPIPVRYRKNDYYKTIKKLTQT